MHFTTVTANPCIDRTIQVDSVNLGHSHRVQKTICDFSGKGINVSLALTQLGNEGGQKFWSWWGFTERQEWCACFVSWCADQAGLIQSGAVPKFSVCTDGKNWFQNQGRWQGAGSMPSPGAIIFFDWEHDGTCDHVGIVERCDGTTVYTIEGNSGDAVKERSYSISSDSIMGYGMVVY